MFKRLLLALLVSALTAVSFAQVERQLQTHASIPISPDVTSTCASTFSSGSGQTLMKFCVTSNGNITQFESPAGYEHIRFGSFAEGYSICDVNANKQYYNTALTADLTLNLPQDIVTTSHQHAPHSSIWMAKGSALPCST